ncbi:hypothetical protein EVAR_19701_1 [Eumeta japonica]|uniref:Uncharacterized protein n=1 Tax=Eumeta variegata TaxID=151549 RepID=A0A4C1V2U5_EUMVA|nr:hypothetical protein EVAR_19701_1 [Eumeta japonica]
MVVGEKRTANIMDGIESTGDVRLHDHRLRLKQRLVVIHSDRSRIRLHCHARNFAAVKFVTKTSLWSKIGTRRGRRKGRGAQYLRNISFAANLERQSFGRCTVHTAI